jgi:hypothetical protein
VIETANPNWLKHKYSLTPEDFKKLLRAQNNCCRICKDDIRGRSKGGYLKANIDHDHVTKVVRGLLCARCNMGLGHFKDEIRLLAAAIVYLQDANAS